MSGNNCAGTCASLSTGYFEHPDFGLIAVYTSAAGGNYSKVKFKGSPQVPERIIVEPGEISSLTDFPDRRKAKLAKILPWMYLEFDWCIYLDSSIHMRHPPDRLIKPVERSKSDIGLFKHPCRSCAYEEIEAVRKYKKDTGESCDYSRNFLLSENFEQHQGLFCGGAIVRRNTEAMRDACAMWWELICLYTSRDQVMLPYVLQRHGITPHILEGDLGSL